MLLCDSCDLGWHANCLRPTLLVIPEGDWFCPDCSHSRLLEALNEKLDALGELEKKSKYLLEYILVTTSKISFIYKNVTLGEVERRRKERIANINANLSSVLPSSPAKKLAVKKPLVSSSETSSSESSDSEDEPMMLRKCRAVSCLSGQP